MGTTNPAHGISGVGQHGFIARHGLYSAEQAAAADEVAARIRELGLSTVRLIVVDQHGVPRSKSLSADVAIAAMSNGLDFSGAIYSLDTGNQVFVPAFAAGGGFGIDELTGFPDVVLVPDPGTFRVLPWADRTGWMLCDVYFSSGAPMPLDGRGLMRRALSELAGVGYDFLAGIEVEYYIVKVDSDRIVPENAGFTPAPPAVSVFQRGYQYLSEVRLDSVYRNPGGDPRRPERGRAAAEVHGGRVGPRPDGVQLQPDRRARGGRRRGAVPFRGQADVPAPRAAGDVHVPPALPNFFSSGWHLHESLISRADGRNAFASQDESLSPVGRQFVAGLLEHALPMTLFAAPTVNGYKRYRPYSFAPDRVCWAVENRGALVRVQGAPGDSNSHVENRIGEPAANPYLYMAANIAAGLDGIRRKLEPPAPVEADPYAAEAPMLPTSLREAVGALVEDNFYRKAFGDAMIDYLIQMKRAELARYESAIAENPPPDGQEVSDWEMREYFEFY